MDIDLNSGRCCIGFVQEQITTVFRAWSLFILQA